jgi:large subunit ribosomal protein L13
MKAPKEDTLQKGPVAKSNLTKNKKKTTVVTVKREIKKIDLKGLVFGRAASVIALLLSGKQNVSYEPHKDGGDKVIAFNLDKIKIKGSTKLDKKIHYHYSGYPGGIKGEALKDSLKKDSARVFKKAVFGMLPKNSFRKEMIKRLSLFKGEIE